jgi:phage FluMu protein Com
LHKTTCWRCNKEFEYDGEQYRDVNCLHCGVLNSIYNPADYIPPIEGEEDMLNYGDEKYQGKFVYMPKMGETATFEIKELREAESDDPRFNFSENVPVMANGEQVVDDDGEPVFKKKDLGYHVEAELENGKILSVTSFAAFAAVFKANNIQDGDKIKVEHLGKGEWKVTKL